MKNGINSGITTTFTAGGTIASGAGVVLGTILGVNHDAVVSGETGVARIQGAFTLPKLSTAVIGQGVRLTWDVSAGEFIIASAAVGDLENCAIALAAAGNGTTTVRALLTPGTGTVKAS